MPTGYTAILKTPGVSFETFALRCARAIDYLGFMRDDSLDTPIPHKVKPSTFYKRKLRSCKTQLKKFKKMGPFQAAIEYQKYYQKQLAVYKKLNKEKETYKENCRAIMDKVNKWNPPATCASLKTFMIDQLKSEYSRQSHTYPAPKIQSAEQWVKSTIRDLNIQIKDYELDVARTIKNAEESNAWLKTLRTSLAAEKKKTKPQPKNAKRK